MARPKSQEENVLGHLLRDPGLLKTVDLGGNFFINQAQRIVLNEIKRGHTDSVIIAEALTKAGVDDPHIYLDDLWTDPLHLGPGGLQSTVDHVRVSRLKMQILKLIQKGADKHGYYDHEKIRALYDECHDLENRKACGGHEMLPVSAHTERFKQFLISRDSRIWGLDIKCFPLLTRSLMGLRGIAILIAEAKVGKSTFALQVASDVAGQGVGVLYLDYENGYLNLMAREVCRKHKISYREELFKHTEESELSTPLLSALRSIEEDYKHFAIVSDPALTADTLRSHISQLRNSAETRDVLVVVDSLQKLPMESLKDRRASIDGWLRDFEMLKSEDPALAVFMVSEVSRGQKLAKESGDIEYSADFLLRLRKNKEKSNPEDPEPPDDMKRKLFIEYARDVESGRCIHYEADFDLWTFTEEEGGFG